jgi:AbrB family looped-hinge helix DNA binding protein
VKLCIDKEASMKTVTVSPQYQIVLPRAIRDALDLRPGQEFRVLRYCGRIQLIPVRPIEKMRGFLNGIDTAVAQEPDRL